MNEEEEKHMVVQGFEQQVVIIGYYQCDSLLKAVFKNKNCGIK